MTIQLANGSQGAVANSQIQWAILGCNPQTRALSHIDENGHLVAATVGDSTVTTRVDLFGYPRRTRLIGKNGYDHTLGETLGETQSRDAIFSDFEAKVPNEFVSLVQRPLCIVAPAKGSFKIGRSSGNDFVSSKDGGPANLFIRGKPSKQAIFEGSGNLASGSSQELVLQAQITAAFNRQVLMRMEPSQCSHRNAATQQATTRKALPRSTPSSGTTTASTVWPTASATTTYAARTARSNTPAPRA